MDLLAKLMPSTNHHDAVEPHAPLPIEVSALQEEVRRLRQERTNKEAGEASLLTELQKRCDKVIALETQLDAAQAHARRLQQERDRQTAMHTQLVALLTGTGGSGNKEDDVGEEEEDIEKDLVPALVGMKARLATLEQERKDGKRVIIQREEELGSLRKQVVELTRVVVSGGGGGDPSKTKKGEEEQMDKMPSAAELGLPEDVRLLLQKCPWTEAVLGNTLVTEEVYEWEGWSLFHGWSGAVAHLSQSTPQLQDLVLRCSASASLSPQHDKTITDSSFAALVDPETMVLPAVGWEWLGGWKVDDVGRRCGGATATDSEGWTYGCGPEDLIKGQGSDCMVVPSDGQGQGQGGRGEKKRRVRVRRWVRVRVLSSVPGASDMVNAFLGLRAKVASLETLSHKLSEQVLALQGTVNDREAQVAQAVGLDRKLVAVQARAIKAERAAAQYQQELARQQGEAKLRQALEGGGGSGKGRGGGRGGEEGGGSVKAVGEAVSKWFAGLGERAAEENEQEEEGGEATLAGGGGEEASGGGLKKWLSKESFDKVKSSLGSSSGSIVTDASSSSYSEEVGGEGGGGPPPLLQNALRWFHKEVIQPPQAEDDPIESWADDVRSAEEEVEEGQIEHLTEEEKAALQKQLDEAEKEQEKEKDEKETATDKAAVASNPNDETPGTSKKKKKKQNQHVKEQQQQQQQKEPAGRKEMEVGKA